MGVVWEVAGVGGAAPAERPTCTLVRDRRRACVIRTLSSGALRRALFLRGTSANITTRSAVRIFSPVVVVAAAPISIRPRDTLIRSGHVTREFAVAEAQRTPNTVALELGPDLAIG